MLSSWLLNTLSPHLRSLVSGFEDARELWNNLKDRFSVSNGTRICQFKSQISACKQRSGESLADYYGRLQCLLDDLASQEVVPRCGTDGSACSVARFFEDTRAQERLHRFLIGLDDR